MKVCAPRLSNFWTSETVNDDYYLLLQRDIDALAKWMQDLDNVLQCERSKF